MMKISFKNIRIEGILPAIIQDKNTKVVLDSIFMDQNALNKSITEKTCYFLENALIKKYPELNIRQVLFNEEKNILLIKVSPTQLIEKSLWNELNINKKKNDFLGKIEKIIELNSFYGKKKSYSCPIFQTSLNKIVQKLGEEATELIIEAKEDHNDKKFLNEAADLIFNFLILLNAKGLYFGDVLKILCKREKKGKLKIKIDRFKEKIRKHIQNM